MQNSRALELCRVSDPYTEEVVLASIFNDRSTYKASGTSKLTRLTRMSKVDTTSINIPELKPLIPRIA